MRSLLVLCLTITVCLSTLGEASRCDPKIIRGVWKTFWNYGNCVPQNLLKSVIYFGPGITKRTTETFSESTGQDEVACSYNIFEANKTPEYRQRKPWYPYVKWMYNMCCSSTLEKAVYDISTSEKDGVLMFDQAVGDRWYILLNNRLGVRAFYKCSESGEIGEPDAKVKVSKYGYDEQSLANCLKDMESIGIAVNDKVFDDSCAFLDD